MLKMDTDLVYRAVCQFVDAATIAAMGRIKTALVEAQNTAHNSAMVLCDDCGDVAEYHLCKKCMRKDAAFYAQHH
jgi:Fe2+ or Zn2+ uptake regulation protein